MQVVMENSNKVHFDVSENQLLIAEMVNNFGAKEINHGDFKNRRLDRAFCCGP